MKQILFILLILIFVFPILSFSAGIIVIPDVPPLGVQDKYLHVTSYRVHIDVRGNVAHVSIDEEFYNPYNARVEGIFLFPLPYETTVNKLSIKMGDKIIEGKIYEKDKARKLYEETVRKLIDPALLEYIGRSTYKASIAPISPEEKIGIHIEFIYTLSRIGHTYYVTCPLSGLKYSPEPVKSLVITGDIDGSENITNLYSPLYPIDSQIEGSHATFSMEKTDVRPEKDLLLYFSQDTKEVSSSFLVYKNKEEESGYFMFLVSSSPKMEESSIPKDIIIVLDTSGSMLGNKIKQAKEALYFIIDRLKEDDRIKILAFSSSVRDLNTEWVSGGDKDSIRRLKNEVEKIRAAGGTNIYDALSLSFSQEMRDDAAKYIIFLTDGMPTVGQVDEGEIEKLTAKNIEDKRLFIFGIGDDVNLEFLTRLFRKGRGQGEFILEKDIETAISSFYSKIEDPMLSNIQILYPNDFYDIYPKDLQDLFWGQNLIIFGRYEKNRKKVTITLKGDAKEGKKTYVFQFEPTPSLANSFIPYLWAARKIGYLLEEIRLNGENEELVETIISLSKKYGIVTPYTSYFAKEKDNVLGQPAGFSNYSMAPAPLKRKVVLKEQALQKTEVLEEESDQIKRIKGRIFIKEDDYWIEEGYNKEKVKEIKLFSNEYFKLLSEDKNLKDILSLRNVIFRYKDIWIKIVE